MLSEILRNKSPDLAISGQARLLVELIATHQAKTGPVILISSSPAAFLSQRRNLHFFLSDNNLSSWALPMDERTAMHAVAPDPMLGFDKAATRFRLASDFHPDILLLAPESLVEKFPNIKDLQKHAQLLIKGASIKRSDLLSNLITLGYSKVSTVIDRGTFAVRGSIIDIFVNGEHRPIRLDLFGDDIDSIKYFDENSQRSLESIDHINIGGVRDIFIDEDSKELAINKLSQLADQINYPTVKLNEKLRDIENGIYFYGIEKLLPAFFTNTVSILELIINTCKKSYLPKIIFDDKFTVLSALNNFYTKLENDYQQANLRGDLVFSPHDYFIRLDQLQALLTAFEALDISRSNNNSLSLASRDTDDIRQTIMNAMATRSQEPGQHLLKPLAERIKALHRDGLCVIISVSAREHETEIKNLLQPLGINLGSLKTMPDWFIGGKSYYKSHIQAYILINKNSLFSGAIFDFLDWAIIAEDDIFGHRTKRKGQSGKQQGFSTAIADLEPDDLVVHVEHGVGQFKGLKRLSMRGIDADYILIIYAKDEKLYLPVHRINLIKPHGVNKDGSVKLDKLGGTAWQTKKSKVKEAVMAMAQDLLKLYAKREIVERPPFLAPDEHFYEFEAAFPFETTPDQQKAIDDVIADMQKKQPMDRLVCGDVGYGKTEVAIRAAMLAVLSKRQVAILAPTTILAQQHGLTLKERFKNTGVNIVLLSRFQSNLEIKNALQDIKQNKVDIVIGTHRLLSPDVSFYDLGLLVVDEEQRFGIKDKEHLKKMRTKVDVLTMSATPIPRTMQMSYFGIRDLSIIETPPIDRRSIQTQIVQFDDAMIREAILFEISRGGQVYFVHNRVQSIEATASYLKILVPEARVAIAHGQMGEHELENKMLSFIAHEINVLVCTTIIETGIDVSLANTMFIDDADDFGLSQLYQLRGRIGRSKERAFAYLLIKTSTDQLTAIAKTRLEILHKFSELGAGFRIAQHDLELRGAGDLLGKSQHGHMAAIGYDLYAELLLNAVKELKGQVQDDAVDPEVVLPVSALISDQLCPDLHERLAFYQRLASADNPEKIDGLMLELQDLYGDLPPEAQALRVSTQIKLALKKINGLKLEISKTQDNKQLSISISLAHHALIDQAKIIKVINNPGTMRITPQQKIIQLLGITSTDLNEAMLTASLRAIEQLRSELLLS